MKKQFLKSIFAFAILLSLYSFSLKTNWFKAGTSPQKYEMGKDAVSEIMTIKSTQGNFEDDDFGTYMTSIDPKEYLGKRIRLRGMLKSTDVKEWAGFWLRVDGENKEKSLAFDNMYNRSIKGTTDWTSYDIVLDVSKKATNIAYGALISKEGSIAFKDVTIEVVSNNVPKTSKK